MRYLLPLLLCACASLPRLPVDGCTSSPEPLTGFLGVAMYPYDLDHERAVYCGCAITCEEYGPTMVNAELGACMYEVPENCATRAVFCEDPGESV